MTNPPDLIETDRNLSQSSAIPEGWARALLGQISEPPQYGWTTSAAKKSEGLKLLRTTDISRGDINWSTVPSCLEEPPDPDKYVLRRGDIIVSRAGSVGISYLIREAPPAIFASYLIRFRPRNPITSEFLSLFLRSPQYWSAIADETAGIAIPNVNASKLKNLEVPVAPLAEQKRIVAKVEALLAELNRVRARLEKVPKILKAFRQSVLAAACSGRLTEDWRGKHPHVEPAARLVKEVRFTIGESENYLPSLPEKWSWVALGNYGRCTRGRFSVRPRNDPRYFVGKHPFIQIGDLPPEGGWIRSHTQTLNDEGLGVSKKFPKGTVAIAIVGATIGNTGLLGYDICFTDSIVGIETGTEEGNRYLELFLRHRKYDIREISYASGGQPNIKLETLNPYPLALPPLEEQREIVGRVDALFKLADTIEKQVESATKRAEKITQAVLAKAFRGELVPTEAELARRESRPYEPASVLLERIRRERQLGESVTATRFPRHRKQPRQRQHA